MKRKKELNKAKHERKRNLKRKWLRFEREMEKIKARKEARNEENKK